VLILASVDEEPVPIFQNVTRGYPPHGVDVCPVPVIAAPARGLRAGASRPSDSGSLYSDNAAGALNRSSSMTVGTSDRFGILSITLHLIHDATEGPPGGLGPVFPAGDLPGLVDDDARGVGRLFPRPGIGG